MHVSNSLKIRQIILQYIRFSVFIMF